LKIRVIHCPKCGRVKPGNWISNGSTDIKKDLKKKPAQICFHSKRPHTITKMNDNINMNSTVDHHH
jgi:hypothetical protein